MSQTEPAGGESDPLTPDPLTAARLAADPSLRFALQTARAWGVTPTAFLGDPTYATTNRYRYDSIGRVVESMTRTEGWSDADREAAYALADWEAGLCPGCGHDLQVSSQPENEFAYRPSSVLRCHACTAAAAEQAKYTDSPAPHAILVSVALDPERIRPIEGEDGTDGGGGRSPGGAVAAGEDQPGVAGAGEPGPGEGTERRPAGGDAADDDSGPDPDAGGPPETGRPEPAGGGRADDGDVPAGGS